MVKKILNKLKIPFGLAGVSIGSNLIGSALGKRLPEGTTNPLTSIGSSSAKAAGIAGMIVFTGIILEETKKLNPNSNKKGKKLNKFKVPNVQLVRDYGKKTPL